MKTILPLFVICFLLVPATAHAIVPSQFPGDKPRATQGPRPSLSPTPTPFKTKPMLEAEKIQLKNQLRQQLCEKVTANVNFRLNQYEAVKDRYSQRYQGITTKAKTSVAALKKASCSTTTLETDLNTLESKITAFTAAFRDFHTQFTKARELACSDNTSTKGQVVTTRQKLATMKNSAKELQQFVQTKLHPHLKTALESCEGLKGNQ